LADRYLRAQREPGRLDRDLADGMEFGESAVPSRLGRAEIQVLVKIQIIT
jgi:hypothetical protein